MEVRMKMWLAERPNDVRIVHPETPSTNEGRPHACLALRFDPRSEDLSTYQSGIHTMLMLHDASLKTWWWLIISPKNVMAHGRSLNKIPTRGSRTVACQLVAIVLCTGKHPSPILQSLDPKGTLVPCSWVFDESFTSWKKNHPYPRSSTRTH